MVDVTAQIEAAALARVQKLLDDVAKKTPQRLATETRRAALYICKSLQTRTRKAPELIRP